MFRHKWFFPLVLDLCTSDLLHKTFWKCFAVSSNLTNGLPEVADFACSKWTCLKCCDAGSLVSRRREHGSNDRSCVSNHGGQTKHLDKALEPLCSLKFSRLSFFTVLHLAQCRYSVSCYMIIIHCYFRANVSD